VTAGICEEPPYPAYLVGYVSRFLPTGLAAVARRLAAHGGARDHRHRRGLGRI